MFGHLKVFLETHEKILDVNDLYLHKNSDLILDLFWLKEKSSALVFN